MMGVGPTDLRMAILAEAELTVIAVLIFALVVEEKCYRIRQPSICPKSTPLLSAKIMRPRIRGTTTFTRNIIIVITIM